VIGAEGCAACREPRTEVMRRLRRGGYLVRCRQCGHLELRDSPIRPMLDEYGGVDPEAYRRSMSPERLQSAREMIGELVQAGAVGPLLDVGCSFGWLLEIAQSSGFDAYGVDPSASAVEAACARRLRVRCGHFPLEDWGRSDWGVVTYMDVLEHLPDLDLTLSQTVARLRKGGLLAVQVPVSSGSVFLAARALERLTAGRVDGPLRRMLQVEFPYPHLHYFNRQSLEALLARFGLETVHCSFAPIATTSLVDRISWRADALPADRIQALGLRVLLAGGGLLGRHDLLRLIGRRP
jgi:SAM-dependent methyltransferase